MTAHDCIDTSPRHSVSLTRRVVDGIAASGRNWLARYLRRRQQRIDRDAFLSLLGKEGWVYRDMGVSRANVEWAARLPLHVNAGRELEKLRARSQMGR